MSFYPNLPPFQQQFAPPANHLLAFSVIQHYTFNCPISAALATLDQLVLISKVAAMDWRVQNEWRFLQAQVIDYHLLMWGAFNSAVENHYAIYPVSHHSSAQEDRALWMLLVEKCSQLVAHMRRLVDLAVNAVRTEWRWSPPETFSDAVARTAEMLALRATVDDFRVAAQQMLLYFWNSLPVKV